MSSPRVRFAPSPTGNLHIGTLRTALFNWIYARHTGGTFILRIEDTDKERSKPEYVDSILEGMAFLGLDFDEGPATQSQYGPYHQSEKMALGRYKEIVKELMAKNVAYYCFATKEELDTERLMADRAKKPFVYSGKYRNLPKEEAEKRVAAGEDHVIRFKMPTEKITFHDLIRGDIEIDQSLIGDFIIMKADGAPTYNFAVVVDDHDMLISHVIRGEDHISNTPKQMAIYAALGWDIPQWAHLPMILGPDRSKLSKRHGATSITEYRDQGYLPDALFNFLTLLGWSPVGEQELFTREEIIKLFSLERIGKAGAIFDTAKLNWMNGQYLRSLSGMALREAVWNGITEDNQKKISRFSIEMQANMINSVRDNLEKTVDVNGPIAVYLQSEEEFLNKRNAQVFSESDKAVFKRTTELVTEQSTLTPDIVETILETVCKDLNLGKGKVFKPVRLATTGDSSGPHINEVLTILGRDVVLDRLDFS